MNKALLIGSFMTLLASLPATAADITSSVDAAGLPNAKSTPLGLYLTPSDAHAALTANPGILFLDVRDPIEVSFVGHPAGMDANVPIKLATHAFDPKRGAYRMTPNPDFLAQVNKTVAAAGLGKTDPIFVSCRSGGRSAAAARILIKAGYSNVWNLVEGFEGDSNKASGQRDSNGWRNAGLPWGFKLDKAAAYDAAN